MQDSRDLRWKYIHHKSVWTSTEKPLLNSSGYIYMANQYVNEKLQHTVRIHYHHFQLKFHIPTLSYCHGKCSLVATRDNDHTWHRFQNTARKKQNHLPHLN